MATTRGAISQAREDMRVVDSTGESVGSVREVRMGDPAAVTDAGQEHAGPGGIGQVIADMVTGGDLPAQAQARLARTGYLRIDADGLFSGTRYAAADEIAEVTGDTVRLTVPADRLLG